jgi:hypothetical protein
LDEADSFFARSSFFAASLFSFVSAPFSFFGEGFGVVAAMTGFLGVAFGIGFGLGVGEGFGVAAGVGVGFGFGVGDGTGVGDGRWISLRTRVGSGGSSFRCGSRGAGSG